MNKKIIGIVIILMFVFVGLCGCNESGTTNKIDSRVELVDTWIEPHTAIDGSKYDYYKETVKNVGGKLLDKIIVKLEFYDINNNFLFYKSDSINNLANSYEKDFSVTVYSYQDYYENINHVEYIITAV